MAPRTRGSPRVLAPASYVSRASFHPGPPRLERNRARGPIATGSAATRSFPSSTETDEILASKKSSSETDALPFGAGAIESPPASDGPSASSAPKSRTKSAGREPTSGDERPPRRRSRRRRKPPAGERPEGEERDDRGERGERAAPSAPEGQDETRGGSHQGEERATGRSARRRRWQERRRRQRKGNRGGGGERGQERTQERGQERGQERTQEPGGEGSEPAVAPKEATGMLVLEKGNHGHLRQRDRDYMPAKSDVHVAPRLVQKHSLREGSILHGPVRRGQGRHKWELADVVTVDGRPPAEVRNLTAFKKLTSIDPDFHYAVGDGSGEVSLMVMDLLCPVGRGQRGLIVAPPRSGKTILLQQFAKAIEKIYPEVHLVVLLVDERPEEATEWRRTIEKGEVFVSTNDEMAKKHVELAEAVWRRCCRMVELGEDVILLMDSITRLGRAYNNVKGNSGRTMSGGIDTRALERPKQFFGAARNTETAGSLTILGTTLVETGSRMDQVIFEEFKGTGNMELVLSRKLADRRIFPAIDVEKTGTRKEEKLHSTRRLHRVNTLRRVLTRMHWAEAMELLVGKLLDVEKIDDFLERFDVDPEA